MLSLRCGVLGSRSNLNIFFDEVCGLDARLHIKADVHLDLRLLVCQLDDWHLGGKVLIRGSQWILVAEHQERVGLVKIWLRYGKVLGEQGGHI
jgi:hypothetical protein